MLNKALFSVFLLLISCATVEDRGATLSSDLDAVEVFYQKGDVVSYFSGVNDLINEVVNSWSRNDLKRSVGGYINKPDRKEYYLKYLSGIVKNSESKEDYFKIKFILKNIEKSEFFAPGDYSAYLSELQEIVYNDNKKIDSAFGVMAIDSLSREEFLSDHKSQELIFSRSLKALNSRSYYDFKDPLFDVIYRSYVSDPERFPLLESEFLRTIEAGIQYTAFSLESSPKISKKEIFGGLLEAADLFGKKESIEVIRNYIKNDLINLTDLEFLDSTKNFRVDRSTFPTRKYIGSFDALNMSSIGEVEKDVLSNGVRSFKDPESVKFRDVFSIKLVGSVFLCGELNGKNSYGGYVGFKRFIASAISLKMEDGDYTPHSSFVEVNCEPKLYKVERFL